MNQVLQAFVRGKTSEIDSRVKDPALRYNPVVMSVLDGTVSYDEDGRDMVEEAYKLIEKI
ncbi:hypothetical protein SPFM1_00266 [Salmonella phage SPFM1]|nr:hypothetical protein SPFM1_00266 [Salmonella phage SPFM1]